MGAYPQIYEYFGRQLRQAVTFLEDVLGRKMGWDRLREVCVESNKQGQLLLEFQELKKAIPCPAEPDLARQGTEYAKWTMDRVSPKVSDWLEKLVRATEQRVKEGKLCISQLGENTPSIGLQYTR